MKKSLASFFAKSGFIYKSNHFYKDISEEVKAIFGLNASNYGRYYYLEYGFSFHSLCKKPYPKYTEMSLYYSRFSHIFEYETLNEESLATILEDLEKVITEVTAIGALPKMDLINHFFQSTDNYSWYIFGDDTAEYFGMTRKDFVYHFVNNSRG